MSYQFSTGWSDIERSGPDCLTTGDESAIGRDVDTFVSDLASALAPQSSPTACSSQKLAVAGKKASGHAKCDAKAVARGAPIDAACLQQATARFANAWTKAEALGDCLTTADQGTIEERLDDFVDARVGALVP